MRKNLLLSIFIGYLSIACSQQQSSNVANESELNIAKQTKANPDVNGHHEQAVTPKFASHSKKRTAPVLNTEDHTVFYFNNEKFTLISPKLIKGAKVYNMTLQELGIIKGGLVIVGDSTLLLDTLKQELNVSVTRLAKDTYRLLPQDQQAIMSIYKRCSKYKGIKKVEIEVDYSPINELNTH